VAQKLIEVREKSNANYPYQDLEEGFGNVTYYGYEEEDSVGAAYSLGKSLEYSSSVYKAPGVGTTTYTFYTGTFQRPRTVSGSMAFTCCVGGVQTGAPPGTIVVQVKVYHYDGTTSTQINTTWVSATHTVAASSTAKVLTGVSALTRTKFKEGDSIKIEVLFIGAGNLNANAEIGMDPQNRDAQNHIIPSTNARVLTQMIFRIPFKLVTR